MFIGFNTNTVIEGKDVYIEIEVEYQPTIPPYIYADNDIDYLGTRGFLNIIIESVTTNGEEVKLNTEGYEKVKDIALKKVKYYLDTPKEGTNPLIVFN